MKKIWAPWRMEYITQDKSGECIFCSLPKAEDDKKNFILYDMRNIYSLEKMIKDKIKYFGIGR